MLVPAEIEELADELYASRGVTAVVVGGSRATGAEREGSDWDLGVYYRHTIDLEPLSKRGEVHAPGRWGRIMNGGSWLTLASGLGVDVLMRDLDVVEHWTEEARHGRFAIDGLPGYVAGIPTYSLTGEASVAKLLRGELELGTSFPAELAVSGSRVWRLNRDFSLYHATMNARRQNPVVVVGQAARAVLEEAHSRCCAAERWVLNEKHLIARAGLGGADPLLRHLAGTDDMPGALEALRSFLDSNGEHG